MVEFFKVAESILKVLAILAGAAWAIFTFLRKREWYPKAKISHKFTVIDLDSERRILRVELVIENSGEKLLRIKNVTSRLQQILPLATLGAEYFDPPRTNSETPEVPWPTILPEFNLGFVKGEREVEPGESDTLQFDHHISTKLKVVQIYSYVANHQKWVPPWKRDGIRPKEIGWHATDIFTLSESKLDETMRPTADTAAKLLTIVPEVAQAAAKKTG